MGPIAYTVVAAIVWGLLFGSAIVLNEIKKWDFSIEFIPVALLSALVSALWPVTFPAALFASFVYYAAKKVAKKLKED
jgi:hypothetical protein